MNILNKLLFHARADRWRPSREMVFGEDDMGIYFFYNDSISIKTHINGMSSWKVYTSYYK